MPNTIILSNIADAKAGFKRAAMSTMVTELVVPLAYDTLRERREVRPTPTRLLKIRFNSTPYSLTKRISDDKSGVEASTC
ncbi:hypothetical protein [Nostoc sp. 'Peltigera malacea cyanobiont' DB3992]|uniref:hypothetical protein n=1 Tax=Nostoc sp. 'Peltigera malacea cyanobiont' DB3992 TaxID=1206980 RepID=UPI001180E7D7|nr:hypothetical protein [Nostoc sp. 'Peltigera malacea cyanobiont' DB3992]